MKSSHEMLAGIIQDSLLERTLKNPNYSLRAMARDLGVSPATISGFLTGKRKMSGQTARYILQALKCPPEQIDKILESWSESYYKVVDSEIASQGMEAQAFNLLTIMAFMETQKFDGSLDCIVSSLRMPLELVKDCMNHLVSLGAIRETDGRFYVTRTKHSVLEKEIQSRNLASVADSLSFVESFLEHADDSTLGDLSDMSLMFIPSTGSKVAAARSRIRTFRRRLAKTMKSDSSSTPFLLSISLLPLTGWNKD